MNKQIYTIYILVSHTFYENIQPTHNSLSVSLPSAGFTRGSRCWTRRSWIPPGAWVVPGPEWVSMLPTTARTSPARPPTLPQPPLPSVTPPSTSTVSVLWLLIVLHYDFLLIFFSFYCILSVILHSILTFSFVTNRGVPAIPSCCLFVSPNLFLYVCVLRVCSPLTWAV